MFLIYFFVGFCLGLLFMYSFRIKSSLPTSKRNVIPTDRESRRDDDFKMVLIIRTDLNMTKGKVAAQCCHATLANYENALEGNSKQVEWLSIWKENGQAKITLKTDSEEDLVHLRRRALEIGLIANYIRDAGRTQIAAGSMTVLAIGPAPVHLIDSITGHLKLY